MDATWQEYPIKPALKRSEVESRSFYLAMRDGVKIAVAVYLPKQRRPDEKLPTVIRATRYYRQFEFRWPFSYILNGADVMTRQWLANGYARVQVDVRGTGASFGAQYGPWSPDEVKDSAEVVDWVIQQTWSSGVVGFEGVSYHGTAAEMALINRHPAVKAVIPSFTLFDLYADIAYPGGVHLSWFTENWGAATRAMDQNRFARVSPPRGSPMARIKPLVRGIAPVDDDRDRSQLAQAIRSHEHNWDPHQTVLALECRDERWPTDPHLTADDFSPHHYIEAVNQSGAAVYSYGGWLDGGYPRAAIQRFLSLGNPANRLVIGPWSHGGLFHSGPRLGKPTRFNHMAEMMRFFDHHLKSMDNGLGDEEPIHYFTMVEEKWRAARDWPPQAEMVPFYLQADGRLGEEQPSADDAADIYTVDYSAGTGDRTRWNSVFGGGAVVYPDRAREDRKLLTYATPPLARDVRITGHPLVTLYVSSSAVDGNFFVYLEDVEPSGRVNYVTEGMLRALHRKVSDEAPPYACVGPYHSCRRNDAAPLEPGQVATLHFDLLPTSYLFKAGHSIRVGLAGADKDNFVVPSSPPPTVTVHRSGMFSSHVILPRVDR
jgi:hypothetical protein